MKPIHLAHVELNDAARRNVQDCIDTGRLARGKYIEQFEEMVADYVGTQYAVAVCNGTMADVLIMRAMKEVHGWEHVQVPALTFAAQIAAVIIAGLRPVFVDLEHDSLAMQKTRGPRFDVALLGTRPILADTDTVVDSCEAFYRDAANGFQAATFSFYATHVIGIGEGGMICTDSGDIADFCEGLRDHGQDTLAKKAIHKFKHQRLGYNAKMGNLYAAIGCGLMEEADEIVEKRKQVARWYDARLRVARWPVDIFASPHGYPIWTNKRDELLTALENEGIEARRLFSLMAEELAFRRWDDGGDFRRWYNARELAKRGLYLPCHQGMTLADVERICDIVRKTICATSETEWRAK